MNQTPAATALLLTPDDVATQLGIPKATLYVWRTRKQGPPAIRIGKHLRWRQDQIDAWLDTQSEVPLGKVAS